MIAPVQSQLLEIVKVVAENAIAVTGSLISVVFMLIVSGFLFKALRKADLKPMFLSEGTGEVSSTKFWSNIAYFIATVAFLMVNFTGTSAAIELIWLIYLGVVGSAAVLHKLIALKFGTTKNKEAEG